MKNIRNFSIIAHIDHGKSTLADRLIQLCGGLDEREMKDQVLDTMDLEQERGITIKAQSVSLDYLAKDGKDYILNLIDTPGHVDFSYEVSRSLAACEGALLVVDASQGVEAQSVANCYSAIEQGLEFIPVINNIDLDVADRVRAALVVQETFGFSEDDIIFASAKDGSGVQEILTSLINRVPCPSGNSDRPLRALIFDSKYDKYKGVVAYVRIFDGVVRQNTRIKIMSNSIESDVLEIGVSKPEH